MVFGFLLLVVIYVAFKLAAETGQDTAVSLFLLAGAALAPYFWASAMRFRLGATRWRGVRLQFAASWGEVYKASWPVFAMALVWIAVIAAFAAWTGECASGWRRHGASEGAAAGLVAGRGRTGRQFPLHHPAGVQLQEPARDQSVYRRAGRTLEAGRTAISCASGPRPWACSWAARCVFAVLAGLAVGGSLAAATSGKTLQAGTIVAFLVGASPLSSGCS